MRRVLTGYAVYFNHRHKRVGHLFQNRYRSILCQKDAYFLELVRYIHLNPLRAGIIKTVGELERYPWSGHGVLVGKNNNDWQARDKVLQHFGFAHKKAIQAYRVFIEEGKEHRENDQYEGGGLRRSAGGWEIITGMKKAREYWQSDERILGEGEFVEQVLQSAEAEEAGVGKLRRSGWDLEKIAGEICKIMQVKKDDLRKKWRVSRAKKARALVAYWGKKLGISGIEISKYLGVSNAAISYLVCRGEQYTRERGVNLLF